MAKQVLLNARSYLTYDVDRINLSWFLWLSLRLWRKFSVFYEFEIVFGSHVIRFSAQSNVRLICYWSDWKGTYLTWPRNCLLWKGKMSTIPSVWKNLFCRHQVGNDLLWEKIACILINFYTDPDTQTQVRASFEPIHVISHWPRYLFWPGPKFMKMPFKVIFWPFYLLVFWPRCTTVSFDMVCPPNKITYFLTYYVFLWTLTQISLLTWY